jgi:hypothetical protein
MGIFAATWMASFRSRASIRMKPPSCSFVSAKGPSVVDRRGRLDRLEGLGDDEVTAPPEGLIVGEALLGAGVGLPLGQGVHILLHKIDQADVLHSPLLEMGWLRTPDGRPGTS